MKNILIVIPSLKLGGGAEKIATTVGNALYEKGYSIKYLTFYDAEIKYDYLGEELGFYEKLSGSVFINFLKLFKRALLIKRICTSNNIDICLSHMEEANFSNVLSKLLFGNKSKIYIQIHASIDLAFGKIYKLLIKLLYNYPDKIITVAKEERENLIAKYGITKVKIEAMYNSIDIQRINSLKIENLPNPDKDLFHNNKFTFINIGRLTYQKNHELLLNVFEKFNRKYSNSQLIILGEGELKEELVGLREKLNAKLDIHFLGNKTNPYNYLANSDCFVFTSRFEGFGIVIIEAMACGLPIISTDCKTGPKEILKDEVISFGETKKLSQEDYGILVPVYNENTLFEAMESLYQDKDLNSSLKFKSMERSLFFDIDTVIKDWINIL